MSDFERQYYESDDFWRDSLQDVGNKDRIERTASLIPIGIKNFVDLGCGNGVFLDFIRSQRPELNLVGMDRSAAALKYVKTQTIQGNISELPFGDKSFDCSSCLEVIEHLPVDIYEKSLSEIARISSQYVIISVPYKERLEESFNRCPQCKSAFSYEMHLRSFDDKRMEDLLTPFGFKCVSKEYLGEQIKLVGHSIYRRLVYPDQVKKFFSPICPVCGFVNVNSQTENGVSNAHVKSVRNLTTKQKLVSLFTAFPKMVWPKEKKYYWILCLYKRIEK